MCITWQSSYSSYNKIHSKNLRIYWCKLYIGKYYEVQDVIKYMRITNYLMCASCYFVLHNKQKATPSFCDFLVFQENTERKGKIMKDEKKHKGPVNINLHRNNIFVNRMVITFVV